MNEVAACYVPGFVKREEALARDLETELPAYCKLAFRVAYSVLRQREDAEDVAQEAVAKAFRRLGSLRDAERFRPWLVRIAWRMAIDRRRSASRRERLEEGADWPVPSPTAEEIAASGEVRAHVWRAVDHLPEKLRIVIVSAAIEGQKIGEVARLLDLPEGTVKSRLHLARKTLAEKLKWIVNDTKLR